MLGDLSPFALIMLGFVAGWVVEWLIDLALRRRRMAGQVAQGEQRSQGQEEAPAAVEAPPAAGSEATATTAVATVDSSTPVVIPPTPAIEQGDDLATIPGIGPAYARLLRERGVFTYEDLARLDEPDLRTLIRARPSWEKVDVGAWIAEAQKRAQERRTVTAAASLAANAPGPTGSAPTSTATAERAQDDGATQE